MVNDDLPALLTLEKTVTSDFGGTAEPGDWTLSATGPTTISGTIGTDAVTEAEVPAGTYTLAESGGPTGYTAGDWSCTGGTVTGTSVVVPLGGDVTCTINNTEQPAQLTLVKEVDAAASGSGKVPADWTLTATPVDIDGQDVVTGNGDPTSPGGVSDVQVFSGDYNLSEDGPAGFDPGDWVCEGGVLDGTSVTVPSGGDVVCRITNTAISPTLTLIKSVVNDHGGNAEAIEWELIADGPTPISGSTGDLAITNAAVQVGTYDLSETGPPGYEPSDWVCTGTGTQDGASVSLAEDQHATCEIVNDDIPASLTLVKVVEGAGAAEPTAWTLSADGPTLISGATGTGAVTDATVEAGTYDLAETGPAGYSASDWVCVGGTQQGASITVPLAGEAACTITNTLAGQFDVTKSSDPPSGSTVQPGDVITYTVTASKLAGVDPTGVLVNDDLSMVLDNATLVEDSITPPRERPPSPARRSPGRSPPCAAPRPSATRSLSTPMPGACASGTPSRVRAARPVRIPMWACAPKGGPARGGIESPPLAADPDPCSTTH